MKISDVMTPCPYRIPGHTSLQQALEMMNMRGVRHLPVIENDELIGVVTLRELELSKILCETTNYCPTVGSLCKEEPVIVSGDEEVPEAVRQILEAKSDFALIADGDGNLGGIFTSRDAMQLLQRVLSSK